eukprot:gene25712-biopygen9052
MSDSPKFGKKDGGFRTAPQTGNVHVVRVILCVSLARVWSSSRQKKKHSVLGVHCRGLGIPTLSKPPQEAGKGGGCPHRDSAPLFGRARSSRAHAVDESGASPAFIECLGAPVVVFFATRVGGSHHPRPRVGRP